MIVTIDPGHGGSDPGAGGYGLQEKDIALVVGAKVKYYLQAVGYKVVMTRNSDKDVGYAYDSATEELQPRCDISNRADSDIFVSIHCNAFNQQAKGTQTSYCVGSAGGSKLADCIQKQIIGLGGLVDRGTNTQSLYVTKHTNAVAVLVELAFIDQADDAAKLGDPVWQDNFARAIARGVTDYCASI